MLELSGTRPEALPPAQDLQEVKKGLKSLNGGCSMVARNVVGRHFNSPPLRHDDWPILEGEMPSWLRALVNLYNDGNATVGGPFPAPEP